MANGDSLRAGMTVLRRFDPDNEHHWSSDDAGKPPRLRSGAFEWNKEPNYSAIGCSTYEEEVLIAVGGNRWSCIEPERPGFKVAEADVDDIRKVTRKPPDGESELHPIDVIEDRKNDDVPEVAHSLVAHDAGLRGRSAWHTLVAHVFTADLGETA